MRIPLTKPFSVDSEQPYFCAECGQILQLELKYSWVVDYYDYNQEKKCHEQVENDGEIETTLALCKNESCSKHGRDLDEDDATIDATADSKVP